MKKGFTLIELLAVIVILAIIALIATPIILGIINDARKESQERSIELYASAAKNAVAKYQLNNTSAPTSFDQLEIEYDGDVVCTTKELYEDGSIYLADCTVNGDAVDYTYGEKQESEVAKACTLADIDNDRIADVGEMVTCNISDTPDKFYVIEEANLATATEIKMLTEMNIHTTEYRQSDDAGTSIFSNTNYWVDSNYTLLSQYGTTYPANVYDDNSLVKPIVDEYVSYLNLKLTGAAGSLLTYSLLEKLGCSNASKDCTKASTWIYQTNYWTGSVSDPIEIGYVKSNGYIVTSNIAEFASYGVRPVITISTSDIQ